MDLNISSTYSHCGSALFPIYYTVAVLYTMLYQIAYQFHLITTRKHLNNYINKWEHADLLSKSLWQELHAASLKYNHILHPSSQGVDAIFKIFSINPTPSQS